MFVSCLWISIIKVEMSIVWIGLTNCGNGSYLSMVFGVCAGMIFLKCNSINRHFTPALPRHSKEVQPVHSNALDFADFECKDWRAVKEWCTSFPSEMLGCFAQIRHTDFEALRNSVLVRWTLWIEQWRNWLLPQVRGDKTAQLVLHSLRFCPKVKWSRPLCASITARHPFKSSAFPPPWSGCMDDVFCGSGWFVGGSSCLKMLHSIKNLTHVISLVVSQSGPPRKAVPFFIQKAAERET